MFTRKIAAVNSTAMAISSIKGSLGSFVSSCSLISEVSETSCCDYSTVVESIVQDSSTTICPIDDVKVGEDQFYECSDHLNFVCGGDKVAKERVDTFTVGKKLNYPACVQYLYARNVNQADCLKCDILTASTFIRFKKETAEWTVPIMAPFESVIRLVCDRKVYEAEDRGQEMASLEDGLDVESLKIIERDFSSGSEETTFSRSVTKIEKKKRHWKRSIAEKANDFEKWLNNGQSSVKYSFYEGSEPTELSESTIVSSTEISKSTITSCQSKMNLHESENLLKDIKNRLLDLSMALNLLDHEH
uniref:Phlebovirus_G2 domain-containing protein n=1 Tax=Rhabditophanes sp. KR3021 TaxID=114890 RepID=A0AC35UD32_9BILA